MEAKKLADKMLKIVENGIIQCEDDGCMLVYGTIRDCGYKIQRTVEQEQISAQRKVAIDEILK